MIQAKVITDSVISCYEKPHRISTMVVTMPRYILAEFNTHRMFSRNSASSRAIKFEKLLESVKENPFVPIAWMKDHPGMQGSEYFTDESFFPEEFKSDWLHARDFAINTAKQLSKDGLTKQLVNRLLEPFMWHTVIVTATEWENFFALRCPQYVEPLSGKVYRSKKDLVKETFEGGTVQIKVEDLGEEYFRNINKGLADIHMMATAEAMWDAFNESKPKELAKGEWHIPFGEDFNFEKLKGLSYEMKPTTTDIENSKIKIATARCARISYTLPGEEDKPFDYKKDIELHDRLLKSGHMSAFEHCAKAMDSMTYKNTEHRLNGVNGVCGNFVGWVQYRKTIPGEAIFSNF